MGAPIQPETSAEAQPPTPRHVAMNWARRLKRVFGIDIESCTRCGGKLAIIASIEEPQVIAKILAHLQHQAPGLKRAGPFGEARGWCRWANTRPFTRNWLGHEWRIESTIRSIGPREQGG